MNMIFKELINYKKEDLVRIRPKKIEVGTKGILLCADGSYNNVIVDKLNMIGFTYSVNDKKGEYAGYNGYTPNLGQWYEEIK